MYSRKICSKSKSQRLILKVSNRILVFGFGFWFYMFIYYILLGLLELTELNNDDDFLSFNLSLLLRYFKYLITKNINIAITKQI